MEDQARCPECRAELDEGELRCIECGWVSPDYDPTPWCHACGARSRERCKCGPIADNN